MESPRWNIITPSQYEWERRGLDFIRTGLPDHDPYRAWSNFEFQTSDGAIYEVDLLVLTKLGFWLVECKAWEGRIYGDPGTWTRSQDGRLHSDDNPALLANRKAKALSSLLKAKMAAQKVPMPWLDALVFLSDPDLQCDLQGAARKVVVTTSGWSRCHSASRRSTSAPCTAGENFGLGRTATSSVSGTGLFGHAPYTVALEMRTTRLAPTAAAAASTRRVPSTLTRAINASSEIGSTTPARCTMVSMPSRSGLRSVPAMSTRWKARLRPKMAAPIATPATSSPSSAIPTQKIAHAW
jgi:hypothetical protein